MAHTHNPDMMALLRDQVARLERRSGRHADTIKLATGYDEIDDHLVGGLLRGAVHEFVGGQHDQGSCTRPARFAASILSRHPGRIVWLSASRFDLHAAGLQNAGLDAGRLICVEATPETIQGLCEDILRERGVLALVADLDAPLTLTASRRLQLAAEAGGVTGMLLHRLPKGGTLPASASFTRWQIGASPSVLLVQGSSGLPTLGAARWPFFLLAFRVFRRWHAVFCPSGSRTGARISTGAGIPTTPRRRGWCCMAMMAVVRW
ncbi:protein imuA [Acetobacter nitrogenifigens DSM 23921 = NBRC 105050]|uniref:Protein ImuA n=1 Tax=Acetobacter nitrogenifigens DSM 23921 = NBRC 105050 TaxID=1120919 RepID=A0A511XF78_9PROT|nr:hypothetical protein [Acetobacter nitrogenifigens]GBR00122.1 protein imuA [Acetobacter nitrogenifigens DSM 23921 = NBRC 105050]GEN61551.1 hypothetical protein ANI02nite_34350 [Acetobacter nitrogenifigens DSM 23921 = NBRC 105050]